MPHLLQILHSISTRDSCIAANQNTFWEWMGPIITFSLSSHAQLLTVPAQAHPQYQSSTLTLLDTPRPPTLSDPGDQRSLKEDAVCVHLTAVDHGDSVDTTSDSNKHTRREDNKK